MPGNHSTAPDPKKPAEHKAPVVILPGQFASPANGFQV